ncbi:hypothetical protein WN51_09231 [Melipona quadrifasciata]|uniref:Uncharacterized protein n=1 Tax=Melipona quadrifasciata TaxID=166423 RepID=A0A0M9AAN6_9HYME|nr:hypothetical protein WN51_09231 [Melipona quadrifasciata]
MPDTGTLNHLQGFCAGRSTARVNDRLSPAQEGFLPHERCVRAAAYNGNRSQSEEGSGGRVVGFNRRIRIPPQLLGIIQEEKTAHSGGGCEEAGPPAPLSLLRAQQAAYPVQYIPHMPRHVQPRAYAQFASGTSGITTFRASCEAPEELSLGPLRKARTPEGTRRDRPPSQEAEIPIFLAEIQQSGEARRTRKLETFCHVARIQGVLSILCYTAAGWAAKLNQHHIRKLRSAQRQALLGAYRTASWESICVMAVYKGFVHSILCYAAAGWAAKLNQHHIRKLRSAQRQALLEAYRTASNDDLAVLAAQTPINNEIKERIAGYYLWKKLDFTIGNLHCSPTTETTNAASEKSVEEYREIAQHVARRIE